MQDRRFRRGLSTAFLAGSLVLGCATDRPPTASRTPSNAYSGQAAGRPEEPTQESIILVITCRDVLLDLFTEQRYAGDQDRPAADLMTDCDDLLDTLRRDANGLFRVTVRQEMDFENGRFDDDENAKRLTREIKRAEYFDVRLPSAASYLITEHDRGRLRGARLEFAVRLLQHHISTSRR